MNSNQLTPLDDGYQPNMGRDYQPNMEGGKSQHIEKKGYQPSKNNGPPKPLGTPPQKP